MMANTQNRDETHRGESASGRSSRNGPAGLPQSISEHCVNSMFQEDVRVRKGVIFFGFFFPKELGREDGR